MAPALVESEEKFDIEWNLRAAAELGVDRPHLEAELRKACSTDEDAQWG